jgi:hypothetical protein
LVSLTPHFLLHTIRVVIHICTYIALFFCIQLKPKMIKFLTTTTTTEGDGLKGLLNDTVFAQTDAAIWHRCGVCRNQNAGLCDPSSRSEGTGHAAYSVLNRRHVCHVGAHAVPPATWTWPCRCLISSRERRPLFVTVPDGEDGMEKAC